MATTIHTYRSYNFVNKDPIIDKVRTVIQESGLSYKDIHEESSISETTLRSWFHGKTRKPQNASIEATLRGIGYERVIVKMKKPGEASRMQPNVKAIPITKKKANG